MQNKMKKDLERFREFTRNHNMDFMVVGSLALQTCGIELDNEPHDLDVEVKLNNPEDEKIFQTLSDASGNDFYRCKESYPETSNWKHKPFIFKWGEITINVWIVKNDFTHKTFVYKDYVKYAGVMSVLREKMRLKRNKDYREMSSLINKLTKM